MSKIDYTKIHFHAGKKGGIHERQRLWHTDSEGKYWCGLWYHRTPEELLKESLSVIQDLLINHSDLKL